MGGYPLAVPAPASVQAGEVALFADSAVAVFAKNNEELNNAMRFQILWCFCQICIF